jgi:tRNA(fMet)-specific endonuclease VapC
MTFLLDANAWIGHLRQTAPAVTVHLGQYPASDITLCSVVLAELIYGAERSAPAHRGSNRNLIAKLRSQYVSLPFDDGAAEQYGPIRAYLAGKGSPIGPNDLMIASIALAHRLTLVTHNTAEFSRVPGLNLADWQVP